MEIKKLYLLDIALRINAVSEKLKDKIQNIEQSAMESDVNKMDLYEAVLESKQKSLSKLCKMTIRKS